MKKFLYIVIAVFFLSCGKVGWGQTKIDSLLSLLKTDKQDTNKVIHLNDLAWELRNSKPDTSIILSNQVLVLCEKFSLNERGKGDIFYFRTKASTLGNMGVYYRLKADYPKALDYFLKALKIDEELNNKKGMASRLGNIGNVYNQLADYPKALNYYLKALKIDEELNNKKGMASRLGNIGVAYMEQADYTKALYYYFKALKMAEEMKDKNSVARHLGNIGNVYKEQVDYPKAFDYYFKALKIVEELGDKNGMARHLGNIGSLYTKTEKYKEAEEYLSDALKIDKEIGAMNDERQTEEALSTLYEKTGRHKEALQHYKNSMLLKDTIFSAENKKQMIRKEMNFEFEKKEAVAAAEQEKQEAVAAAESRKQQIIIYAVIGVLLLVIVFSLFLFNRFRITNRQKVIIEQQKEQVDKAYESLHEKNKEVMDSINYASRIQRALLPSQKYIESSLNRLGKG